MYYAEYDSPVGILLLTCSEVGLTGLWMNREAPQEGKGEDHPILLCAKRWLDTYFRGEETALGIPLMLEGTMFQKKVWDILLTIPYGETRTYGQIAREVAAAFGKENMSAQAVGQAVGSNPISILVPCHRVVGARGQLTGYAGGLDKKIWLLQHEGQQILNNRVL